MRPVAEDVGAGGTDPYGDPLSFSRKSIEAGTNPGGVTRTIVDGSFKAPQLRNVALTPPYFHNGGFATCIRCWTSTGAAATGATPA